MHDTEGDAPVMDHTESFGGVASDFRIVRQVGPWLALAAVVFAATGIWSGFQADLAKSRVAPTGAASVIATPTVTTAASAVTAGTVAIMRVAGTALRADASAVSKPLAVLKKGERLQVIARTDTWLKVRDSVGRVGWIANSTQMVEIRTK